MFKVGDKVMVADGKYLVGSHADASIKIITQKDREILTVRRTSTNSLGTITYMVTDEEGYEYSGYSKCHLKSTNPLDGILTVGELNRINELNHV